jgi:Bacterial toxin 28
MSRVAIDPGHLEVAARRLEQAGADLGETARQVGALAVRLPPALAGPYQEASWPVRQGLDAQAEALGRLAAELRLVRRAAELAVAGGFEPGLAALSAMAFARRRRDGQPRRPPSTPPPMPPGVRDPADEELLRWLREQAGWRLLAGPGGLAVLQLTAAGGVGDRPRSSAGTAGAGLGVAALLGLLLAAKAVTDGSAPAAQPTPTAPAKPRDSRCDPGPPGEQADEAKATLLDPRHIDAARREQRGEVVARKPSGTAYDHVQEYKQEQDRVRNQIAKLKQILGNSTCTADDKSAAERKLQEASRLLDWTERNVVPGRSR